MVLHDTRLKVGQHRNQDLFTREKFCFAVVVDVAQLSVIDDNLARVWRASHVIMLHMVADVQEVLVRCPRINMAHLAQDAAEYQDEVCRICEL